MAESWFDILLVIKWQNTHFHQFPKRFNRPALCYIGVQWTVQTPSKTEASTDPNLSRSCQPLRDTTRAIRDTTGCPRSEDINSKINGEKHVQYEWWSLEQSSSECRCLHVRQWCILLPDCLLLQLSSMAETRYIIISSPVSHLDQSLFLSTKHPNSKQLLFLQKRAVYFLSLFYCPDPLLSDSLALLPYCNQCYVTPTPRNQNIGEDTQCQSLFF